MLTRLVSGFRRLFGIRPRVRRDPRATFEYWDGANWRSVDPIAVWAVLTGELGGDLADVLATVTTPAPPGTVGEMATKFAAARQAAGLRLADAVCRAFDVEPYRDGAGLTVPERVALASSYIGHMARLGALAVPT